MNHKERLKATQQRRAEQFALCSYALERDPSARGAEALFDQALTNGLALIVAHAWPGKEFARPGRMLSARDLLGVIKAEGIFAETGVTRVLHDPAKPEFVKSPWFEPGDEGRLVANFTEVRTSVLERALGTGPVVPQPAFTSPPRASAHSRIPARPIPLQAGASCCSTGTPTRASSGSGGRSTSRGG